MAHDNKSNLFEMELSPTQSSMSSTEPDSAEYQQRALETAGLTKPSQPLQDDQYNTSYADSTAAESAAQQLRQYIGQPPTHSTSFSTTDTDPSDYQERALAAMAAAEARAEAESTPRAEHTTRFDSSDTTNAPTQHAETSSPVAGNPATSRSDQSVRYIETEAAYNEWAPIYDTDGNFLQQIDDIMLSTRLPAFLSTALSSLPPNTASIQLLDLGCGTGRTTLKLLSYPSYPPSPTHTSITGIDFSAGMLEIARSKLHRPFPSGISHSLLHADAFSPSNPTPIPKAHIIVSTLVLEHIPLPVFFSTLSSLLLPGGYALITNMHPDMGAMSQAGFVGADGVKVRGKSSAHGVLETIEEAHRQGLEYIEGHEKGVNADTLAVLGPRAEKWRGVNVWYCISVRKRKA